MYHCWLRYHCGVSIVHLTLSISVIAETPKKSNTNISPSLIREALLNIGRKSLGDIIPNINPIMQLTLSMMPSVYNMLFSFIDKRLIPEDWLFLPIAVSSWCPIIVIMQRYILPPIGGF
jgi:hypothetical protein